MSNVIEKYIELTEILVPYIIPDQNTNTIKTNLHNTKQSLLNAHKILSDKFSIVHFHIKSDASWYSTNLPKISHLEIEWNKYSTARYQSALFSGKAVKSSYGTTSSIQAYVPANQKGSLIRHGFRKADSEKLTQYTSSRITKMECPFKRWDKWIIKAINQTIQKLPELLNNIDPIRWRMNNIVYNHHSEGHPTLMLSFKREWDKVRFHEQIQFLDYVLIGSDPDNPEIPLEYIRHRYHPVVSCEWIQAQNLFTAIKSLDSLFRHVSATDIHKYINTPEGPLKTARMNRLHTKAVQNSIQE